MAQFNDWIHSEFNISEFEKNGEDNYALIDLKSKIVYAIGHDRNGLILDFNWNNNKNVIDSSLFRVVRISDKDYESIYQGKKTKVNEYSIFI